MKAAIISRHLILFLAAFMLQLRFAVSAHAERRGQVTSAPCPHSCRTLGVPKKHCRDWREGNTCYVEDLTRPANEIRQPKIETPATPSHPSGPRPPSGALLPRPSGNQIGGGREQALNECRELGPYGVARPRIDIFRVDKRGNYFKTEYRVEGAVEGICLVEAGYFERGRKETDIAIQTSRGFGRYEFEVVIDAANYPEIRVYNINGEREVLEVNPEHYR